MISKGSVAALSVTLPKGGGAVTGISETLQADAATGTAGFAITLPISPGRGLEPQLSLDYNSGAGNGLFGMGFSLDLPNIARKTARSIPRYDDSDTFIFANGEDLVPCLIDHDGTWLPEVHYRTPVAGSDDTITQTPPTDGVFFLVARFRTRVEGLFARVERWTRSDDGDVHWRVITADNVTSVFGESAAARIADPADPARIFRWLIERTFDATGEQIVYAYLSDGGNAYPHTIKYGNVRPQSDAAADEWHFAIGFDYSAAPDGDERTQARPDPFTSYRSGFAIRTALRCVQITMSHRFAELADNRLTPVAALIFTYETGQRLSLLQSVRQVGYRDGATGELPPLQCSWSRFDLRDGPLNLQQLRLDDGWPFPAPVEDGGYQFVDLYGEGLPGILYTDAQTVLYSRPLGDASYAAPKPPFSFPVEHELHAETHALVDLAGDGRLDLVVTTPMRSGSYEPRRDGGWEPFHSFAATPNDLFHPQRKLADVTGDGLVDLLLVEPGAVTCYPSRGRLGYGAPTLHVTPAALPVTSQPDAREVVRFADPFGDGGSHLVRVRDGSVACWPSLGYGRFGPKVEFANPPRFGAELDGERLFFADIDGSGPVDLIYAHTDRIDVYLNQGNAFSDAVPLPLPFPWSALSRISFADVLGNGAACLVLTSVAPDLRLTHYYYDFTGGTKPYLLTGVDNAMGAATHITYRSSTHFYLADAQAGTPWITRLPFPVQVVAQIETIDQIGGSRLTASYSYHHGAFDPIDRTFRGFGRVERLDAESHDLAAAHPYDQPPVLTRNWYHLGLYADVGRMAQQYAGEYYQGDAQADALADPQLDPAFAQAPDSVDEALRALHGHLLREEVYGADAGEQPERTAHPYLVSEASYAVRLIQPRAGQAYAVCLVSPSEAIMRHYERNPSDPRVNHELTLEVDAYGNVLRSLAVGYGRRSSASDQALAAADRANQAKTWLTYAEHSFTNAVDTPNAYHVPLPCESREYELTGFAPQGGAERFSVAEWTDQDFARLESAARLAYEQAADGTTPQRRLIGQTRTFYRPDDLGRAQDDNPLALLPLGRLESLALHGETYSLALTPGLLQQTYTRDGENLLLADLPATPAAGGYVDLDTDGRWWQPGGRHFFSPGGSDTAAQELAYARAHFFRPRRFRDPFHSALQSTEEVVSYDAYDLLPVETRDALGNTVQAEHDYRVLQPRRITDPNGNRSAVAFDTLGMVTATAIMGKAGAAVGDSLEDVATDIALADLQAFMADPQAQAATMLGSASSRIIYDRDRFRRAGQPPFAATLARETHLHDQPPPQGLRIQIVITYADGFGRELQQKLLTEAGEAPARLADVTLPSGDVSPGSLIQGQGGPATAGAATRWIGSGRTIYTNKGLPVRQYEPFFSATHLYEGEAEVAEIGVSSTLLYDPLGRAVATLHPNHSWEKHVFDPWRSAQWDVSDTLLIVDPGADPEVGHIFRRLPDDEYLPTWHALRTDPTHAAALAARYPDPDDRAGAAIAAEQAGLAAATPEGTYLDALGRVFLQVAHNRYRRPDAPPAAPPVEERYATRIIFDIEGNQREVIDAAERVAMRAAYDLHGRRIFLSSIDAGERWTLSAVDGKPVLAWDSRGYRFRSEYDALRRPVRYLTAGLDPAHPERERLTERLVYGEQRPDALSANLRGRLWRHLDQAGLLEAESYDFKGNLLRSTRRLARSYRESIDWGPAEAALLAGGTAGLTAWLEDEAFTSSARYDALDRPRELIAPDQSVIRPSHNQTGRLERVEVELRGAAPTPVVAGIMYNAKGQRTRIDYGNGVRTAYGYDPQTFDLIRLKTTRRSDSAALQALRYTYDPAENILRIRDDAQQTIFFRNRRVAPGGDYTYDAIHRLIAATGREHLGQAGATPSAYTPDDAPRVGLAYPGDGDAMGRYVEQYVYDALGNLLRMQHRDDAGRGWARSYAYDTATNRLIQTSIDGANPAPERYAYDAHGNMTAMPHLPLMQWDVHDQLRASARQVVTNGGTPETTWYVYDAAGQRVRQVTERQAAGQQPTRKSERIYLGGFEISREYAGGGATVRIERETLHVIDDEQTVALVETRTRGNDQGPRQVTRYQLADHLGSATLELDAQAQIISYEEYSPYGSTSYQAARSRTEAPKRYRYSGKERDDATGFAYYGARYYVPWLARWTSPDPAGMIDGPNLYAFVRGNPVTFYDSEGYGAGKHPKTFKKQTHNQLSTRWRTAGGILRPLFTKKGHLTIHLKNPKGHKADFLAKILKNTAMLQNKKQFGAFYRQIHDAQDELISTSSVRELIIGALGGKNLSAAEESVFNDVLNNISSVRFPTKWSGFAKSSAQQGSNRMQHPTAPGEGIWRSNLVKGDGNPHTELDRSRREYIIDEIESEKKKPNASLEKIMKVAIGAAIVFTLNNFTAPATASDQYPVAGVSQAELNKQVAAREHLKAIAVSLGVKQEVSLDTKRSRKWGYRSKKRELSPTRK